MKTSNMSEEATTPDPYAGKTNEERLAELQEELIIEDEVEDEQENHFHTKSVLPPKDRSTTGL